MSAVPFDLTGVSLADAEVTGWSAKKDAAAALAALRETGRNAEQCITIHPAHNRFFRFYVIARPDPLAEMTWIMNRDGSWARGRLTDDTGTGAPWTHMPAAGGARIPATVTHNYRYSAGSVEVHDPGHSPYALVGGVSVPRGPRLAWFAKAWCVACPWKTSGSEETSVRMAARTHRTERARSAT